MKIKILGWESKGLRCPDIKIDIGSLESIPKITLIQMPNGTGKTTTLNLIRAALTGQAKEWDKEKILQMRHKDDVSSESGKFILRLLVDQQPLTFDLTFDFVNTRVSYRTSSVSIGGVVPDYQPPPTVRRFLKSKFTNLFVFDGEYATLLLNEQESRAEDAIDALCQLDLLDLIQLSANNAWQSETKNKGAKTQQGLSTHRNKEALILKNIEKVTTRKSEAEDKLQKTQAEIESIQTSIGNKVKESEHYNKELESLRLQEKDAKNSLDNSIASAMSSLRRPDLINKQFLDSLIALKINLDKAKLPDVTSRQFFVELAEGKLCVCGRPISHIEKDYILSQTNQYLGNEVSGIINSMKLDIDAATNLHDDQNKFDNSFIELSNAEKQYHSIQTELQALEHRALSELGTDISPLRDRLTTLGKVEESLQELLNEINRNARADDKDNETCVCLLALEAQLNDTRKNIAEITETVELKEKIDIINKMSLQIKDLARTQIKQALVDECNQNLAKILVANPISIMKIERSIHLSGQKEASAGQTLAAGYTFLTAALSRGKNKFPLIVDSPAGPLDDNVRKEIGEMVPKLCEQFIAFTISTEREHFLPALEKSALNNIQYLTIFRKNSGTAHLFKDLPTTGVIETETSAIVEGRDYFTNFTIVKELED